MATNSTNPRSNDINLNIGTINICGLSERSKMVLNYYANSKNFDALAVQETQTNLKENLELDNMQVIQDTNNAANKGACLLVSNKHSITKLENITKISKHLDSCWGLLVAHKKRYIIGSIYVKLNYKPAMEIVMKMLQEAEKKKTEFKASGIILLGDFNARHILWGDKLINFYGKSLSQLLDDSKYSICAAETPTFLCSNGSSFIDLSIISNELTDSVTTCKTDEEVELFSGAPLRGHVPLLFSLTIREKKEPAQIVKKLDLSKIKWNEWTNHIENRIEGSGILAQQDDNPYELWNSLDKFITEATESYCPTKKSCRHSKPYWTAKLTELAERLKIARKNYIKRGTTDNYQLLNNAKTEFDDERKNACQNFLINIATQLNSVQAQRFWKDFNKLFKKKTTQKIDPLYDSKNRLQTDNKKIESSLFEVFFEAKHLTEGNFDQNFYEEVNNIYDRIINEDISEENDVNVYKMNAEITLTELKKVIKSSANSVDNFNFHPSMLKHLGTSALNLLLKTFNMCLKNKIWVWKTANVIFLRKAGKDDYSKPGSYRPICITSYIGKSFEAIIANRIEMFLKNTNQVDQYQEGFSQSKNTIRYLNRLHLGIHTDKEENLSILCLFVDFEKAFDSVWKIGLLTKLHKLGIKGNIFHLIRNFLFGRTVQLNVNGTIGNARPCSDYGLPQGSVLSPVLFKIYLYDFLTQLSTNDTVSIFKFADDGTIKIAAENSEKCVKILNNVLELLHTWAQKWRMKINCDKNKTEVICFNTNEGKQNLIPETFKIGEEVIHRVHETKVLGLVIDENLTYKSHCQLVIKSLKGRWASLCKYSNKYWGFNIKIMIHLIKTLFISKLSYAGHIWMTSENIRDLNQLWYHILKSIVGAVLNVSQRNAELILGIPPLQIQTQVNSIKHFLKLINTPVQQDIYKQFLQNTYNAENKSPSLIHKKLKETLVFLKWKHDNYPTHFNEDDKIILTENNYSHFFNLSEKACSYTQSIMKNYTEKTLWYSLIKNQLQMEGHPSSPNPKCDIIPIPQGTSRKTEVQVLALLYKNNILNQSLYNIGKKESPLCRYCNANEETPEHFLFFCSHVNETLRKNTLNAYKSALSSDEEVTFEIGILNAIRNGQFLARCIEVVEHLNFDIIVDLSVDYV